MPAPTLISVPIPPTEAKYLPNVGRLDKPAAIRRELARLYRDGRHGRIDASDASKLGSLLSIILRVIEATDIERRLAEVEKRSGQ